MAFIRRLFSLHQYYENPLDRQRARSLLVMNWVIFVAWFLFVATVTVPDLLLSRGLNISDALILIATPLLIFTIYQLVQTGRLNAGVWLFLSIFIVACVPIILNGISNPYTVIMFVALSAAGALLHRRPIVLVAALMLVITGLSAFLQTSRTTVTPVVYAEFVFGDTAVLSISLIVGFIFLFTFRRNIENEVVASVDEAKRLRQIAGLNAQLGEAYNEADIVSQTADLINEQFAPMTARVFLFSGENANEYQLYAGGGNQQTGAPGDVYLNENNIVGRAIRLRQVLTTSSEDRPERRSHFAPMSQHGITIPIMQQQQVIGILDVQTPGTNAFTPQQTELLQMLVNQMVVTLAYTRRVNDLWNELRERERTGGVAPRTERAAARIPQAGITWDAYLRGRTHGYNLDAQDAEPVQANDLPEIIRPAMQTGMVRVTSNDTEQIINVPIKFRGQTLGAMAFALPKDEAVSERQLEMAQIVSDRLGLALENTRLFEQTQAQAEREHVANDVASLLFSTTDLDSMLATAANSFRDALGAVYTRVYLQPEVAISLSEGETP